MQTFMSAFLAYNRDFDKYSKVDREKNIENKSPVLTCEGKKYNIEAYSESELEIRAEIFKTKMKAIDVRNATVFFWTLGRELKTILERYSVEKLKQATQDIIQNEPLTKNMDGTA